MRTTMDGVKGNATQAIRHAMPTSVKNGHVRMKEIGMNQSASIRCQPSKAKGILPLQLHKLLTYDMLG